MTYLDEPETTELQEAAYNIRRLSLEMIAAATWGHIGGSFSIAELLAVLYFKHMKLKYDEPRWEGRDRFFLSKAHAAPALYAALALKGFFPVSQIYTYCELNGLEGHTHLRSCKGVESSGGPLGLGLSIAVGAAIALRRKENTTSRVYCLLGDGECNEGNVWEAAMSASHYHADNLIAIVDYNKVMAKGFVWEEMAIEPLQDKWKAFGWQTIEIDGHDVKEIADALYTARNINRNGSPTVIIAHTVKGKGMEEAEFNYKWHTQAPDPDKADEILRDMARYYKRPVEGYSRVNGKNKKERFYGGE
jgi:transketolase